MNGYFYILTNERNTVLYAGSTKNLINRIRQHRNENIYSFTKKYCVKKLIHYETFDTIEKAKAREKQVKGWVRRKKLDLIDNNNELWRDLYCILVRDPSPCSG
ncbi:GIY-YIG nuclease family protein [Candidatus Omnitrophota bacterium]